MNTEQLRKEFEENAASMEHDRWSSWQKYLHSLCTPHRILSLNTTTKEYEEIETGGLVIGKDRVKHWERQISLPYSELTEQEKEYDRIEVRKYYPLIEELFLQKLEEKNHTRTQLLITKIKELKSCIIEPNTEREEELVSLSEVIKIIEDNE